MITRTTKKTVTFRNPFVLGGVDGVLSAGAYVVETDEALLEGLTFPAYKRTATIIHVGARPGHPGIRQALTINPHDLDDALECDRASENGAGSRDRG